MEKIWSIQSVLKEYKDHQVDLFVQNKIANLLEQSDEYSIDLEEEKKRSRIDTVIAENFEIRWYIEQVLDYLENNEEKPAYEMVFTDLNNEVRSIISFISEHNNKFNNWWIYINFFANIISELSFIRFKKIGSFREEYCEKLLDKWINIWKESFYLRIKNEIFDLINKINFEYIYNIKNEEDYKEEIGDEQDEIKINKANLEIVFELIDLLYENKDMELWDIKKWFLKDSFEYIKEFLYVNEENISLLTKNSIYFSHFMKIITLMDNDWKESFLDISKYLEEELNQNSFDKVIINNWYFDEMKAELHDLVKDLNNLIIIAKNN